MKKKTLIFLGTVLLLNVLSSFPTSANQSSSSNYADSLLDQTVALANTVRDSTRFAIKQGEPYNQANDPVFRKSGPESEGPQHGYFAVPLLFIGIAGIVLYFLDRD